MILRNLKPGMIRLAVLAGLLLCLAGPALAQLRVGAAKVDVTPDPNNLPSPMAGVHDPVFTRAILVENGKTSALLVNIDAGGFPAPFTRKVAAEISARYGVPRENMIFSGTHDHSSGHVLDPGKAAPSPAAQAFTDKVYQGILEAVKQAKSALQPAEIGFGEGQLYLNVNRTAFDRKTMQWVQGVNPDFPSDKTLAVLVFRKPKGGEPIAITMNYAMHAITMFLTEVVSGDFPGVAQNYVEEVYGNKAVALWTQGAEGDQNPLYLRAINAITDPLIRAEMDPAKPNDHAEYNQAKVRLFQGNLQQPFRPLDAKQIAQAWRVVEAEGTLAAEETLRVISEISSYSQSAVIQGAWKDLSCPARKRIKGQSDEATELVQMPITIGALRLGNVALGQVQAEPYNKIGQEVKQGSPFRQTMVIAVASGNSDGAYLPSDDAFHDASGLQPGCAETSIVKGIDEMLYRDLQSQPLE